jgi:hypothetical protein
MAFAPDGRNLAAAAVDRSNFNASVTLWDWAAKTKTARLKLDWAVHRLSFSPDGRQLLTDRGAYFVTANAMAANQQAPQASPSTSAQAQQLTVSDTWISLGARHALRLPPDLCGALCDVHGATVFLGMRHGRAMLMEFNLSAKGGNLSQMGRRSGNRHEWTHPSTSKFWKPLGRVAARAYYCL